MSAVAIADDGDQSRYGMSHGVLSCGHGHPRSGGQIDESARRLSHPEFEVAKILASEGHDVRSLSETPGRGPQPDLAVCHGTTEVKTWVASAERGGAGPSSASVFGKLVDASKQSDTVFLYGVGTGLTEKALEQGLDRYVKKPPKGREPLKNIRAKGDGFDVSYALKPRSIDPPAKRPERGPGLDL